VWGPSLLPAIERCGTWEHALALWGRHSHRFSGSHIAALVRRLATLLSPSSRPQLRRAGALTPHDREAVRGALAELHDFAEAELPR
jgi:hypothetical protein